MSLTSKPCKTTESILRSEIMKHAFGALAAMASWREDHVLLTCWSPWMKWPKYWKKEVLTSFALIIQRPLTLCHVRDCSQRSSAKGNIWRWVKEFLDRRLQLILRSVMQRESELYRGEYHRDRCLGQSCLSYTSRICQIMLTRRHSKCSIMTPSYISMHGNGHGSLKPILIIP